MSNMIGKVLANRYRIEAVLGRGGMAEIYKVWDLQRATYLALKLLHEDLSHDHVFIRRFQREGESLARVRHPNIVNFYGLETDGPHIFLLMDYVEGKNLKTIIYERGRSGLDPDFIVYIMGSVCPALNYAHLMGLVHCDIKPANIMLNKHHQVMVTDFGIARMTDSGTSTMSGFGTPAYLAPELVLGHNPTRQSDIYALGILLYELTTNGERPFNGERTQRTGTTSEKVRWEQINLTPPPPSLFNPQISHELAAVILKCLEKEPKTRFSNTMELLTGVEKALGRLGQPQKNKEIIGTAGLNDRDIPFNGTSIPAPNPPEEKQKTPEQTLPKKQAKYWPIIGVCGLFIIFFLTRNFFLPPITGSPSGSSPQIPQASVSTREPMSNDAFNLSINPNPTTPLRPTQEAIIIDNQVEETPPVNTIVSPQQNDTVIEAPRPGKGQVRDVAWSPDGTTIGVGSTQGIYLFTSHNQDVRLLNNSDNMATCIAFSPDGTHLAAGSGDNSFSLWQVTTEAEVLTFAGHTDLVLSIAFSPNGAILASGSADNTIQLWDARSGALLNTLRGHTDWVTSVAFSPDGTRLASGSWDGTVRLWEAATGTLLQTLQGHSDWVTSVAFSPTRDILASSSVDNTIRIWDTSSGTHLRTLIGHNDLVSSIAFSPDGTTLASGSYDQTIRLWDAVTGNTLETLDGLAVGMVAVDFSSSRATLAFASGEFNLQLWEIP